MDCSETRDHLSDLNRGQLPAGTAEAVRSHVGMCVSCADTLQADAELRALVRAKAPRYTAPLQLRTRIQGMLSATAPARTAPARSSGWRTWIVGHHWAVGGLARAVAIVCLVWAGSFWMARDPVSLLAARAVDEHAEYVKETMTRPAADPLAVVRELQGQLGFPLAPVFPGDAQMQLVAGLVTDLSGKRAATFVYRDGANRYATLFLMPEAGIVIPAEGRLPIDTFKPHHRVVSNRQLFLWKQGSLACLLVSDLDQAGSAAMFLKVRKAI